MSPFGPGLLVSTEGGVATVTLSHPERRNAMTLGMWRALPGVLAGLTADPGVRVLVLTGEGGVFSAGADISELSAPGGVRAAQQAAVAAEEALAAFPKPALAAVRGSCVGGGCQLAVACDLRFAAEGARFGVTPSRLGLVYPPAATRRLATLAGSAMAKYLLFSGDLVDAGRALRAGLVDEVLPDDELDARVAGFARALTERSLLTQYAAKELAGPRPPAPERIAFWQRAAAEPAAAAEAAEGTAAFLERRPPRFTWAPGTGPDLGSA
ncbi:enoyl-CoA hydratase/isomerase family protein [Actinacidiphila yeochonensis]|uniref:enoyl-CoA hydratase/isomerase family protein n=1 Tax=Actinacidiphila yeochonensis TaxID=89050 RepID=UPI00068A7025|nr:enoyl-CoA hydratase/isomerase family protein [Actinacidiphila yeochonensis]